MRTTKVKCHTCGVKFRKRNADYNRTERLKKSHFCSLSCSASHGNKVHPRYNTSHLNKGWDVKDQYSPFRYFIKKAKERQKHHKNKKFKYFNITLEYLLELWENQKGICPYTKVKMNLPESVDATRNSPKCASLDRIDPSKGYIKGNVQFITQFVNLGKNKYPSEEIYQFFK